MRRRQKPKSIDDKEELEFLMRYIGMTKAEYRRTPLGEVRRPQFRRFWRQQKESWAWLVTQFSPTKEED